MLWVKQRPKAKELTINLTIRQQDMIVVAADRTVTDDFSYGDGTVGREYWSRRKLLTIEGVCVVTLWGWMPPAHYRLFPHLLNQNIDPGTHTVDDIADVVFNYLRNEYQPHTRTQYEENRCPVGVDFTDHTGYHVCGFTLEQRPKCYNIFWGTDIPPKSPEQPPKYESYPRPHEDQPLRGTIEFIYTGRNDLAAGVIRAFLNEIEKGFETRYDIRTTVGKVQLADLVMRFASEITPQVGPPFDIAIITPDNRIQAVTNPGLSPMCLH
jgi:hypothetical protein